VSEHLPPPSGPGTVVLDVGGDVGAAVVRTPAALAGEELEIRPEPGLWDGRHVAVLAREVAGAREYAAVFGGLTTGEWVVRRRHRPDDPAEVVLTVAGGAVTRAEWPAPPALVR
jgi:hypothetical protein